MLDFNLLGACYIYCAIKSNYKPRFCADAVMTETIQCVTNKLSGESGCNSGGVCTD